jgi:elongator complex protein 2
LAINTQSELLISAAADSTIKCWNLSQVDGGQPGGTMRAAMKQEVKLTLIPLAIAVHSIHGSGTILVVAGSHSNIMIYSTSDETGFQLVAKLAGHSGWIRALSFIEETSDQDSDILLASASQDKFIRLWRVHKGSDLPSSRAEDPSLGVLGKMVSTKAHKFMCGSDNPHSITFEALLLGHEDWVYSCTWYREGDRLQLLSSSADNSVAVWKADETSGIWVCSSRLGDVSAQKGSTTATGSAGGFWNGLWSPDGKYIASLGRTGSWRVWKNEESGQWTPEIGSGGHTRSVTGIAWSRNGDYLLSTSADQTTRLHAQWKKHDSSWHEFARPQIHGYDLNCIDVISDDQFVSGADEKPLRVFQQPSAVADILEQLCGIHSQHNNRPDAANIPVLGLSNKAIKTVDDQSNATNGEMNGDSIDPASVIHRSTLSMTHPPLEDHLSKHLLWPEIQKLYGHGYEISTVSVCHDGSLIATACKASSIDHAVIRLYETKEWKELPNPLTAHSLTITGMQWSPDDQYLLSVGRDRIWSIFQRKGESFEATTSKGHTRMILSCSWAPLSAGRVFATASRDKTVKIWKLENSKFENKATLNADHPVTAVSFLHTCVNGDNVLAMGLENGQVILYLLTTENLNEKKSITLDASLYPNKAVTELAWRPFPQHTSRKDCELAVASEDSSLRIIHIDITAFA